MNQERTGDSRDPPSPSNPAAPMPSADSGASGRHEKYIDDEQLIIQALNPDGSPRRPMNAFMIFARRRRPQVSAANQTMRTGEISKILSREWATMPMSEKEFYLEQAKRLKDTFNAKYPDYVYRRRPNNSRRKPRKDAAAYSGGDPGDDSSDTATTNTHPYEWSPSDAPDDLPPVPPPQQSRTSAYPPSSDYYLRLHDSRGADLLPHAHSPSSPSGYTPYAYSAHSDTAHDAPSWPSSGHHRTSSTHTSWPPPPPPLSSGSYGLRGQRSLTALQTSRHQPPSQSQGLPMLSSGLTSAGPLSSGMNLPQRPWSAATSAGSPSSANSPSGYPTASGGSLHGTGTLHPAHPTPSPAPPYIDTHPSPGPGSAYPLPSHHETFFGGSNSYSPPSYSSPTSGMHAGHGGHLHDHQSGYYSRDSPRALAPPHPYASTGTAGGMLASRNTLWERNK